VQDNIAVDFGLRGARVNDHTTGEIRAGVTFAFGVTRDPTSCQDFTTVGWHGAGDREFAFRQLISDHYRR